MKKPRVREHVIFKRNNLAREFFNRLNRSCGSDGVSLAVGCDDDLIFTYQHDNGSARKGLAVHRSSEGKEQAQENYSPRWMRVRTNGGVSINRLSPGGGVEYELFMRDVDVSDDGKTWFHLLGSRYLDDLPVYTPKNRRRAL